MVRAGSARWWSSARRAWLSRTFFQVVREECFSCPHDRGYAGTAVEGATVVERVASVQQPPVTGVNGDGCVAAGVTGK